MIRSFLTGLLSIWQAWMFLYRHPGLFRYALVPFFINVVVFSSTLYFGNEFFSELVADYIVQGDAWWWQVLAGFAVAIAFLAMLVVMFFTFTAVGNLIAAPFNDVLSQKTERIISGVSVDEPFSLKVLFGDIGRSLLDEIAKLSRFVIAMLLLLLVNFVPLLGPPVFAAGSVLLTLYFLVVEYTGFVFSRKHMSFTEQRTFIRLNRWQALGFGLAVMLTLMIPLVQFLTIPLSVVAATHFCVDNGVAATEM